jgi:hypothetical protein
MKNELPVKLEKAMGRAKPIKPVTALPILRQATCFLIPQLSNLSNKLYSMSFNPEP